MNYHTHNDVEIETSGTSLMGSIRLDYYDILDKLGKPHESDLYKTDAEWDIEFDNGTIATLYNWKDGKNYCGKEGLFPYQIVEWYIGGFNQQALERVNKLFKENDNG